MTNREDEVKRGSGAAPPADPGTGRGAWKRLFAALRAHWRLVFTLLLLFLIAVMYQWKTFAVQRMEGEMREQQKLLTERAGQLVAEKNKALLRLTATSLAWAAQCDMAAGNYGTIDRSFNYLVKQDRFRVILLAKSDGTVIVATDKRMEGFPVDRFYPGSVLRQDEPDVRILPDGSMLAVAPVMGAAVKLGVLLLVYSPETVTLATS